MILCGGQGTRLREVTELLPKPMVPIGEQPVLWHIMKCYAAFGVRRFILCLGYKRESFVVPSWVVRSLSLSHNQGVARAPRTQASRALRTEMEGT